MVLIPDTKQTHSRQTAFLYLHNTCIQLYHNTPDNAKLYLVLVPEDINGELQVTLIASGPAHDNVVWTRFFMRLPDGVYSVRLDTIGDGGHVAIDDITISHCQYFGM